MNEKQSIIYAENGLLPRNPGQGEVENLSSYENIENFIKSIVNCLANSDFRSISKKDSGYIRKVRGGKTFEKAILMPLNEITKRGEISKEKLLRKAKKNRYCFIVF